MGYLVEFARLIISEQLYYYLALTLLFFITQFIIIRKHLYSIFDPLSFFIVFNSFAWATAILASSDYIDMMDITIMNLAFFIPSVFIKPINLSVCQAALQLKTRRIDFQIFYIFFLIFILSTLLLWMVKGIPLFSGNPDRAKILIYQGGFGVVRYIHFVMPLFCILFSLYCLVYRNNDFFTKLTLWFIALFSIMVLLFSGSKSSLLPIVFVLGFLGVLDKKNPKAKKLNRLSYFVFFLAVVMMLVVFSIVSNSLNLELIFELFLIRMIAFGDTFYFWYQFEIKDKIGDVNLIYYLLSPLLEMLKITEHTHPLGAQLVTASTGEKLVTFGPNGQLPVLLSLASNYFKYPLSFMFGCIFFLLRKNMIVIVTKLGIMGVLLFSTVFFSLTYIYTDILLLLSKFYSAIVVFLIFYFVCSLLKKSNFQRLR
jgi:hypothetical protein